MANFNSETTDILRGFAEINPNIKFDDSENFDKFFQDPERILVGNTDEPRLTVTDVGGVGNVATATLLFNVINDPLFSFSGSSLDFFSIVEVGEYIKVDDALSGNANTTLNVYWKVISKSLANVTQPSIALEYTYNDPVDNGFNGPRVAGNTASYNITLTRVVKYPSTKIKTTDDSIVAQADLPIQFTSDKNLENIDSFINKLTQFELPEVTFGNDNFEITESSPGASVKESTYAYASAESVIPNPVINNDIENDKDVVLALSSSDIEILNNVVSQYQMNNMEGLTDAIAGPTFDFKIEDTFTVTPIETSPEFESSIQNTFDGYSELSGIQLSSEKLQAEIDTYNENIKAYQDTNPESVVGLSSYQIAVTGTQGENTVKLELAENNIIIPDEFSMTITDSVLAGGWNNNFTFFIDASVFTKIVSGIDYELVLSSVYDECRLTGDLEYVNIIIDEAAQDSAQATFEADQENYETALAAYEASFSSDVAANDAKLEEALWAARWKKQTVFGTYTAPTTSDINAEYALFAADPNYEANYDTTGPGQPAGANPRPKGPTSLPVAKTDDSLYISKVVYWIPVGLIET